MPQPATKPFQFGVTLAILISAFSPLNSHAEEKLRTVLDLAQDTQDFYPVGTAKSDVGDLKFYAMSGLSTFKAPNVRGAVLINIISTSGEHFQIVEISSINCGAKTLQPNFRAAWNAKGQIQSSGPTPSDGPEAGTLLTPHATQRTIETLCDGAPLNNSIRNRSLSDFR